MDHEVERLADRKFALQEMRGRASDVSREHARCIYSASGELRRLLVYDLFGQIVRTLAVEPETTSLDLDTSTLPPGTYWCRLGDETARFVVVR